MEKTQYDAVVVGAGPNGLAAAITLARQGLSVLVMEANDTIGGGASTKELTLPGFHHDVCSAVHPFAVVSPFFKNVRQAFPQVDRDLELIQPPIPLAHPFDDGSAAVLLRDFEATARRFGEARDEDAFMWRAMHASKLRSARDTDRFFEDVLRPIRIPSRPFTMARFGMTALQSAERVAKSWFKKEATRAIFAGCAAHSMMPLDRAGTASFGMMLSLSAHAAGWPIPKGGSQAITNALARLLVEDLGGEIRTGQRVTSLTELPKSKVVLFDVMPRHLASIAGDALPAHYAKRLSTYRHGPGVFKMDWALSGPIPWKNADCRRAGTVHLGPRLDDIMRSERAAATMTTICDQPFVLVAQQSLFDDTRAPPGKHTAWAYCHVPNGSTFDMSSRIEAQLERFAPGFRDLVLARHAMNAQAIEAHSASFVGGDIGGGLNNLMQVLARPLVRWNEYTTPNPSLFLCSSATPPGGGVHGMCGYWAARAALDRVFGRVVPKDHTNAGRNSSYEETPGNEREVDSWSSSGDRRRMFGGHENSV